MPTVFITAGAKNTGLAIAEKFAQNGFSVAVSSRNLADAETAASNIAEKYGVKARGYSLELNNIAQIKSVFTQIKNDFSELNCFVANAANLGINCDFLSADEVEFENVANTNLKGAFFTAQQAAHLMKDTGGAIVFISSVHSHECVEGRSLYTASKGGVNALMRAVAIELAQYNIRANCVIAGAIRTNRWDDFTDSEIAAKRANWPLERESTGEDIANAVYYLGTDLSKTVTGTELTVDSGLLVSLLPYSQSSRGDKNENK